MVVLMESVAERKHGELSDDKGDISHMQDVDNPYHTMPKWQA